MDAFHRLLRLSSTVKERVSWVWKSAVLQSKRGRQWLMARRRMMFWAAGISIVVILPIGFVIQGDAARIWGEYRLNREDLTPLLTLAAGVTVAGVALARHFAQTNADRQRRITESFSKAVEQLGSDKLEVRLGGIYSLERISKESPDDYWTVMESLTAFVRERSRRNEAERTSQALEQRVSCRAYFLWLEAGKPSGRDEDFWAKAEIEEESAGPPATNIAAVLTVIRRRSERSRKREGANAWHLDLSGAILKQANLEGVALDGANLRGAHLERAILAGAHLERANLVSAHLEGARLADAHLEGANRVSARLNGANLAGAHLEGVPLASAHLERAILAGAHLERAYLVNARLKGANLDSAHLEGANLSRTDGLTGTQLRHAHGDAATKVPLGLRPAHWPPPAPE